MYMYNKHTPWMSNLCLSKPFWLQFFCHPWSSNLEGQLKTAQLERECAYQLDLLVLKSGCCIPTTHNFPRIFHTNPRKKKTGTASLDVSRDSFAIAIWATEGTTEIDLQYLL